MYIFSAKYINMDNDNELERTIEIDDNCIDCTEKEVFLCAMSRAYDLTEGNELFAGIEFIAS